MSKSDQQMSPLCSSLPSLWWMGGDMFTRSVMVKGAFKGKGCQWQTTEALISSTMPNKQAWWEYFSKEESYMCMSLQIHSRMWFILLLVLIVVILWVWVSTGQWTKKYSVSMWSRSVKNISELNKFDEAVDRMLLLCAVWCFIIELSTALNKIS